MSDYAENAIDATIAHQPSPGERFYPAFEVCLLYTSPSPRDA